MQEVTEGTRGQSCCTIHGGDEVGGVDCFLKGSNTVVSNKEPNPGAAGLGGSFSAVVKSAHNRPHTQITIHAVVLYIEQ